MTNTTTKPLLLKWVYRPFIGKYTIWDIIKSVISVIFIMITMSALTIYIHTQIESRSLDISKKTVEYVNANLDNISKNQKINFVVEEAFVFPIHYRDKISTGYIVKDTNTGVKYIYTNTGGENGGSTFTRYWEKPIKE
jgi:hypothetical protein